MTRPRRGSVVIALVLFSALQGTPADHGCLPQCSPDSRVSPIVGTSSVGRPVHATPMWVCNHPLPASRSLAAPVAVSRVAHAGPSPGRSLRADHPLSVWTGDRLVADQTADGYIVFVDLAPEILPMASAWPREKLVGLSGFYNQAVRSYYGGVRGFGDVETWAAAFGVSEGVPILLFYDPLHPEDPQPTAMWHAYEIPVITYGPTIRTQITSHGLRLAVHELAHIWDGAHGWTLSQGLTEVVQNPSNYPTARARDGGPLEDFAESVTAYLLDGYASNERWSDDDARFAARFGVRADEVWPLDRHDYVARLFAGATLAEIRQEADGLRRHDSVGADELFVVPER